MLVKEMRTGELTIPGAARRAELPEYTIRHAIRQGHLQAERRAGRVLVRPEELERYLTTHR